MFEKDGNDGGTRDWVLCDTNVTQIAAALHSFDQRLNWIQLLEKGF